jgi:hypothetical protein
VTVPFVTRGIPRRRPPRCRCTHPREAHHYIHPEHAGSGGLFDTEPCRKCSCPNYHPMIPIDIPDPHGRFT